MFKDRKGFTFIEILVVATVLGIVSTVAVSAIDLQKQRQTAQDAIAKENVQKLSEAIEVYRVVKGDYPQSCDKLVKTPECKMSDLSDFDGVINTWPDGLCMICDGIGDEFAVYTESPYKPGKYYKYSSNWTTVKDTTDDDDLISVRECGPANVDIVIDSCADLGSKASVNLTGVDVTLADNNITIGETTTVTARAKYDDGTTQNITLDTGTTWVSSDPKVARVDPSSQIYVQGRKDGTADIKATYLGFTGKDKVTVKDTYIPPPPDTLTVSAGNTQLAAGEQTLLKAMFNTTDVTKLTNWTTSNPNIVTITSNSQGDFIAMGYGQGTARITGTYGGLSDNLDFTVTFTSNQPYVVALSVRPYSPTINVGGKVQLTATAIFSDNSIQDYTQIVNWSTKPGTYAKISPGGLVTAISKDSSGTMTREDILATFVNAIGKTIAGRAFVYIE